LSKATGDFQGGQGVPWYAFTQLQVVPLTCDNACRASSGDPNHVGGIANFIGLDDGGAHWIRIGYGTDNAGHPEYWHDFALPNLPYTSTLDGLTHVETGFVGKIPYANLLIEAVADQGNLNTPLWYAYIYTTYPVVNTMFFKLGHADFVPTRLILGQVLWGKSGANAIEALYAYTSYETTPWNAQVFVAVPLTTNGIVSPLAGAPPPYANWVVKPTNDVQVSGGLFFTECCAPLP
jgi:hypothetical protein